MRCHKVRRRVKCPRNSWPIRNDDEANFIHSSSDYMNQHVLSGIPRNTLHEMIVDNKLPINVLTKHLTCVLLHFVSIARSGEAAKSDSVDYSVFFLIKMTSGYRKFINGHLKYHQRGHAENV